MNARHWGTAMVLVAGVALALSACGDGKSGSSKGDGKSGSPVAAKPADDEPIAAGGWGDLKIKFVYDGDPPAQARIVIPPKLVKDCMQHAPVDQSLVVGAGGELANVFVYLRTSSVSAPPEPHPDYNKLVGQEVKLVNTKCSFSPHAVTLWTKQKLLLTNEDTFPHNTRAELSKNDGFNDQIIPGDTKTKQLTKSELQPLPFGCSLHPFMKSHVLIRDSPYMAVSGSDGVLTIKNLPTGRWRFIIWHERVGYIAEAQIDGQSVSWKKGVATFGIRPDENALVTVKINPDLFK